MTKQPNSPVITIVGLTDAGKTAFFRTFLRNSQIGTIHAGAGTTGIIDDYSLCLENDKDTLFIICDTPGFQYGHGLISLLRERFPNRDLDSFTVQEILELIPQGKDNPKAVPFLHDILTWNQIQISDTVLAVIDVTEDPDSVGPQKNLIPFWKLIQKNKSLIVILNKSHAVTNGDQRAEKWLKCLTKEGLESIIEYDAHYRNMKAESALFDHLSEIYPQLRQRFMRKKERRIEEEEKRLQSSIQETARYLLKLANTKEKLGKGENEQNRFESAFAEKKLQSELKQAEEQYVDNITKIWGFTPAIVPDIGNFNPYVHRVEESFSKQRIATGAAIGAVIDIPFAGFSLGAGTLIGAATGGFVGKAYDMIRKRCFSSSGKAIFYVPDIKSFNLAIDRSLGLLIALYQRGHGTDEKTFIRLGRMDMIEIPDAIQYLQNITTSNEFRRLKSCLTDTVDKIGKLTSIDYRERKVEKLSKILSEYLSNHLNHIVKNNEW